MSRACSAEGGGPPAVPLSAGADIVEIDAMARLLSHGTRRLRRVFAPAELPPRSVRSPASRGIRVRLACSFAAKEAVFKALGRGWGQGVRWREVSVSRLPSGRWEARLAGSAEMRRRALGAAALELSIATTRGHAVALAVLYR